MLEPLKGLNKNDQSVIYKHLNNIITDYTVYWDLIKQS